MLSSKMQEPSSAHGHQHKSGFGHIGKPTGTVEYVTSSRDTLRSVAVAFDTTTTNLMKLNRMSSLTIFPGQTLYVPSETDEDHSPSPPLESDGIKIPSKSASWDTQFTGEFSFLAPLSPSTSTLSERPLAYEEMNTMPSLQDWFRDLVMVSSKPPQPKAATDTYSYEVNQNKVVSSDEKRKAFKSGKLDGGVAGNDFMRSMSRNSEDRQRVMSGESTESEPFEEGFLKMDSHYVTEHKEMVKGVLLVTPTALMFDPDTEDTVVKRDGCVDYGIMCPMNRISSIAMYNDTTRMTPPSSESLVKTLADNAEDVRSDSRSSISSDTTTEAEAELNETLEGIDIPELPAEEPTTTVARSAPASSPKFTWSPVHGNTLYAVKDKVPGTAKLASPMVQRSKTFSGADLKLTDEKNLINFDPDEKKTEKKKDDFKLEDEFPFLHAVIKTVGDLIPGYEGPHTTEAKPKPQRPNSNHMYLCIRARQRMVKTFSLSEDDEFRALTTDSQETDQNKYPEYWFQVPRKKSDHVYAFFLQWSSENQCDAAEKLGFVVMAEEPYPEELVDGNDNKKRIRSFTNSSLEFVDDFYDESYSFEKEWEIISIQEAKRRSVAVNAIELAEADDSLVPELEKPSNLLTDSSLLSLCKCLPNRCVGYSWSPVYTTYDHGTSLRTLFRNMLKFDAPVVLVIQDSNDHIFGALCSNPLRVSEHYYGTGESFLFTISPNFEIFNWTGENNFFLKGDIDSITIGGGKGTFGLWLDSDLYRGCSHPCETFDNKVLSSDEDFIIQSIEVWMIKDM